MNTLTNKLLVASLLTVVSSQIFSVNSASGLVEQSSTIEKNSPSYEYYKMPSNVELSSVEFELMKGLLSNAVKNYNRQISKRFEYMRIAQPNYGIQYKVTLSQSGDKVIEVNAFAKKVGNDSRYRNLNSEEVIVFDGGSSFFNTTINLKTKKAAPIVIHGFA